VGVLAHWCVAVASEYRPAMGSEAFVPVDFDPPTALVTDRFRLEPLGPQHNNADHAAWTSSIEHIRATPGYPDGRSARLRAGLHAATRILRAAIGVKRWPG